MGAMGDIRNCEDEKGGPCVCGSRCFSYWRARQPCLCACGGRNRRTGRIRCLRQVGGLGENAQLGHQASPSAFAETGLGPGASSVAFVLQVEGKPVFAGQKVQINTSQLNNACHGTLSWYNATATGGQAPGTGTGESFTLVLDNDGNATAVVWGGLSCVSGETFGQVDLAGPTYKTLTTNFRVLSPRVTV
jgi:hypothetical protein